MSKTRAARIAEEKKLMDEWVKKGDEVTKGKTKYSTPTETIRTGQRSQTGTAGSHRRVANWPRPSGGAAVANVKEAQEKAAAKKEADDEKKAAKKKDAPKNGRRRRGGARRQVLGAILGAGVKQARKSTKAKKVDSGFKSTTPKQKPSDLKSTTPKQKPSDLKSKEIEDTVDAAVKGTGSTAKTRTTAQVKPRKKKGTKAKAAAAGTSKGKPRKKTDSKAKAAAATTSRLNPLKNKKTAIALGLAGIAGGAGLAYKLSTKTHLVKRGDTLSDIAKDNNITLKKLLAANPKITDPNKIGVGQKIKVPFGMTKKPVYKGMSKSQMAKMAGPKKLKASTAGGEVAFSRGGKVKGYKKGGSIKPRGVGAALRGWGKALGQVIYNGW